VQPILSGPRGGLDPAAVRRLLQSHDGLEILYGADGWDADFNQVADLTQYMVPGSKITCNNTNAGSHRTCTINIESSCFAVWDFRSGFIRPWMMFQNPMTGYSAKFNLGVYTLPTPGNDLSTLPSIMTFQGYDLIYFLQQPVGDSYEVPANSDPALAAQAAISAAIPGAMVQVTPSSEQLPKQLTWPFDGNNNTTTWLDIVNKLLSTIGYRNVWVDWDGQFIIEPYIDPQTSDPEWSFDLTAENNIVSENRSQLQDLYSVPNWWRFVMANQTTAPVEGVTQYTYIDNSAINPGSTINRGRFFKVTKTVNVTSFTALLQYAQKVVTAALKPSEVFTVQMQPFPMFWHFDVVDYNDPNLAPVTLDGSTYRRACVITWDLPLDGMQDMNLTWQTVNDQMVDLETTVPT
jgi:hypothetical protein